MADRKVVAVIGATGAQGGGLARAILADKSGAFAVRAITRSPDSDKARALAAAGAQVVRGDADDPPSLRAAFAGAEAAYCVTAYWEHLSPKRELAQAGAMARAVKEAGTRHVIWSTLEDTRKWVPLDDDRMPTLMGRYKVPHFDAKGEANELFLRQDVPVTFLMASYYWDNLIHFGAHPTRQDDGVLGFVLPMGDRKLPGIGAEDIGKCALGILKRGDEFVEKTVGIAGEHLTGAEMAEKLSRAMGEPVRHVAVTPAVYRSFGFPGADDLGNMFQFYAEFEKDVRGARDVKRSRELNPELQTFDQWLERHTGAIPRA